jgi:outer membrane protein assembly factor BamB
LKSPEATRIVALAAAVLGLTVSAAPPVLATSPPAPAARLIASPEPGWPQWRGPRRDGICDEISLLAEWPPAGPKKLWQTDGLGRGYSAPIITGGRIYLTGDVGDELHIFTLDLDGRRVWQAKNGRAWRTPYPGARASCTYRDGRLYHLNAHGRVACLDAASGRELWAVELFERFGGRNITWALSENLLVDGSRVFVTAGGTQALMAALDARTGETVWQSAPLRLGAPDPPRHERVAEPPDEVDNASYASPILLERGGRRMLVSCSLRHVFGVDADTGALLWSRPLRTRFSVIAMTPVLVGDGVFVTAPDTDDGGFFQFREVGSAPYAERVWSSRPDTCHGGVVLVDGALYGSWYRRDKGWFCADARTGEIRHQTGELAMGSVLYADGRLYCLSQEGEMALLEPTPEGFKFRGRFRLAPERTGDAWAHPVIHQKRLHLRFHETLSCFDIRAGAS